MKNATRVLLLRHAETSAPGLFHGAESDVGLGARGHVQAETVAHTLAALAPDALYCSAMRRAVETAAPIGRACGLVPQLVAALHERRIGPLSGKSRQEGIDAYEEAKRRWMAGDLDHTHEGGESYAAIRARTLPAFTTVVQRHTGQTIVVVAHGIVIRVLLTTLLTSYGPAHFQAIAIPNVGVNDLRFDGVCWRAERLAGME